MVYWGALEKRCGLTVTVGSNPTLSAREGYLDAGILFLFSPAGGHVRARKQGYRSGLSCLIRWPVVLNLPDLIVIGGKRERSDPLSR